MTCNDWTNQLMERAQPATARVEAAQKLAQECRDHSVWQTLCSIVAAEDEDPVVRCGVVQALPDWNRYAAVNFLATRVFRNWQVRAAVVATLEKMGPVEGELEARLLSDLSALGGSAPDTDIYVVANLAGQYGRDHRVLKYLRELLQSGDEHIRAQAVGALCSLGELGPVLDMAGDPSPEVRGWLCTMLGSYREQSGAGILERLLRDGDAEVAKEAKKALRLLGKLEKAKPGERARRGDPESAWSRLLGEISRVRLADSEVAVDVPDAMVEAGWLGEPGATEEQIGAAERRLGARLPPSYRQFLAESNGFRQLSPFIWRLRGTTEIDWFRTRNTEWIEAYQSADDISPEEHREAPLDSGWWRAAYLRSCLQISDEGDSAFVLLNPEVETPEGEWETWFFANWVPGAERFRSFWDYLEHELKMASEFSKQH